MIHSLEEAGQWDTLQQLSQWDEAAAAHDPPGFAEVCRIAERVCDRFARLAAERLAEHGTGKDGAGKDTRNRPTKA